MPESRSTPTPAVYKGIKTAEGLRLLASEPIAVVVGTGDATQTWHLPKELLVNASPFFAAALNGNFAEATSRSIHLPEGNLDVFAIFIRWLYVGEISCNDFRYGNETSRNQSPVNCGDLSTNGPAYATKLHLQACTLGDKLGCIIFMDYATLGLIKHHEYEDFRPETMLFIFENFGAGSKLRRFAIDQLRWDLQWGWPPEDAASLFTLVGPRKISGPNSWRRRWKLKASPQMNLKHTVDDTGKS